MKTNAPGRVVGYRFRGVVLDLLRGRLLVAGQEVPVTPLPLKLLELLCAANGALVSRAQLFDGVWPRQEVSDDALNKLLSRLREMLGTDAEAVLTVRKQGLRLDAPIEVVREVVAPQPTATAAVDAATEASDSPLEPARPRRWLLPAGLLMTMALLSIATLLWFQFGVPERVESSDSPVLLSATDDPLVHVGYALRLSDIHASRQETLDLLRAAEQAWRDNDPKRAEQLLRAATDSDAASPVAPLLLADLLGAIDPAQALVALANARSRFTADCTPYSRLLLNYVSADSSDRELERAAVDALLTLRPDAWRLQLRRAHLHIQQQNSAAALRSLRAIALDRPPANVLMYVLADRASYGDVAEVRTALAQGALAQAPLQRAYVEARLAWTAQDPAMLGAFDTLSTAAETAGSFSLAAQASALAAVAALMQGRADAEQRLLGAARALRKHGRDQFAVDPLGLAAELAVADGRREQAKALLEQARDLGGEPSDRVELELLNARLGLLPRGSFTGELPISDSRFEYGEPTLVDAWYAFQSGQHGTARKQLHNAQASGIGTSARRESAALLGSLLGEPAAPCWIDPPYPDLLRISACIAIRNRMR